MARLTIDARALDFGEGPWECLLSGAPVERLVPVTLRRMLFLGPVWIGQSIRIALPLAARPSLALPQYLRCFRWALCLLAGIAATAWLELPIERQWLKTAVLVATAILAWWLLGLVVKREPLRLRSIARDRRTCVLSAADPALLERLRRQAIAGVAGEPVVPLQST